MVGTLAKRKPGRKSRPRVFDGERLRTLRTDKGLSQAALAELVGVHEADIGRYERGEFDPSLHTLAELARALEVETGSLIKQP